MNITSTDFNRIKAVDATLSNMRLAGYNLDNDAIALVWKVAKGEASAEEIVSWTQTMAASLEGQPIQPELQDKLEDAAAHVRSRLNTLCQRIIDKQKKETQLHSE